MRACAPPPRRAARPWLVAAACVALTSCGGGDGPSREAFAAQADRVCADAEHTASRYASLIREAQRDADPDRVFGAVAQLTERSAAAARPSLDRLDALAVPADDRDAIKAWVAGRRRRQDLTGDLAKAFARRDEATISRLSQQIAALRDRDRAFAAEYGMVRCADG